MVKKAKKVVRKKAAPKRTAVPHKSKAGSGRGKRYSRSQRKALLGKYRELRKGGQDAQTAAKKVNVSYLTLRKWEKEAGLGKVGRLGNKGSATSAKKGRRDGSQGVTVSQESDRLTLVTPQGFRIEGLSPTDLIKVLKAI